MRFVTVSAPSLELLAQELNRLSIGTGRVVAFAKSGKSYEVIIDMYPVHVITNEELVEASVFTNIALAA